MVKKIFPWKKAKVTKATVKEEICEYAESRGKYSSVYYGSCPSEAFSFIDFMTNRASHRDRLAYHRRSNLETFKPQISNLYHKLRKWKTHSATLLPGLGVSLSLNSSSSIVSPPGMHLRCTTWRQKNPITREGRCSSTELSGSFMYIGLRRGNLKRSSEQMGQVEFAIRILED